MSSRAEMAENSKVKAGPISQAAVSDASLSEPPVLDAHLRKRLAGKSSDHQARDFVLDVQFRAAPGFTILFGASGAGKTTLLDCIAGLAKPDAGRIAIGERVLFDAAQGIHLSAAKRRAGYVFQQLALFPHMTVEQNVEYGLAHLPRGKRKELSG